MKGGGFMTNQTKGWSSPCGGSLYDPDSDVLTCCRRKTQILQSNCFILLHCKRFWCHVSFEASWRRGDAGGGDGWPEKWPWRHSSTRIILNMFHKTFSNSAPWSQRHTQPGGRSLSNFRYNLPSNLFWNWDINISYLMESCARDTLKY